jgi:hypothetical protein
LEQGVFDALSKRYLRAVVFAISIPTPPASLSCSAATDKRGGENAHEKVIETYQWKIGYTDDGEVTLNASRIARTKADLKAQAISLIRALLMFTHTLESLPCHRTLSLKLLYYDERTPPAYEPPFFQRAARGDCLAVEDKGALKVKIGNVVSPQYALELKFVGVDLSAVNRAEEAVEAEDGTESAGLLLMRREGEANGIEDEDTNKDEEEDDEKTALSTPISGVSGARKRRNDVRGRKSEGVSEGDSSRDPGDEETVADQKEEENKKPVGKQMDMEKEANERTLGGIRTKMDGPRRRELGRGVTGAMNSLSLQDKVERTTRSTRRTGLLESNAQAKAEADGECAGTIVDSPPTTSLFLPKHQKIIVGSVGYAELEAVREHILSTYHRHGSWISVNKAATALSLSREQIEAALACLAGEATRKNEKGGRKQTVMVEGRVWGTGTRFLFREVAKGGHKKLVAGGEGVRQEGHDVAQKEEDTIKCHRTPMSMDKRGPEEASDSDETCAGDCGPEEDNVELPYSHPPVPHDGLRTTAQQHAPPKAPRPFRPSASAFPPSTSPSRPSSSSSLPPPERRGRARLASEYLLEQGNGFEISLTQESVSTLANCKASVVSRPIVQRAKRSRR